MGKMLISTGELDDLLKQPINLVLLDARPTMAYLFSHIPGAVNVNWKDFSDPASPMKSLLDSDLARLEKKVGALGVSQDRHVVVYADPFESWGDDGRIFWMLCYLGHPQVQVLDGGWFKWKREGRQVERGPGKATAAEFKARVNSDLLMTKDELKQYIKPLSPEKKGSHQFDSGGRSGEENARSSHAPRAPALAPAEPDAHFLLGAAAGQASGLASDWPGRGGIGSEASRPPYLTNWGHRRTLLDLAARVPSYN